MSEPNKIFVDIAYNGLIGHASLCRQSETDKIYISKDAIMEWAKETYLNENASAIRKVCYKQLIDKLNSLSI